MSARVVLDPSVAIKWYIEEEDSAASIEFQQRVRTTAARIIVPPLFFDEVANILWKKETLRKEVFPKAAKEILWEVLRLPLHVYLDRHELLPKALDIATQQRISVYDAIYVATAIQNKAVFVTADQRLIQKLLATPLSSALASMEEWGIA